MTCVSLFYLHYDILSEVDLEVLGPIHLYHWIGLVKDMDINSWC